MAVIRANRAGNFSDSTMWSSGTVPTSADDVVANNFIVTMDVSATVIQLRNDNGLGGTTGGYFDFSVSGVSITLTGPTPITQGTGLSVSTILVSHISGGTVSLTTTSSIITNNATANIGVIRHTSAGTFILTAPTIATNGGNSAGLLIKNGSGAITINGFVSGMGGGSSTNVTFANTGTGTITINGGVNGGTSTVSTQGITNTNSNATIIVNGAVVGGNNAAGNYAINSTGPINIPSGSVTSNGTSNAILANGGITVNGTVTSNGGGIPIAITAAASATITGNVIIGTGTAAAIDTLTNASTTVTLAGNFTNRAGRQAIACRIIFLSDTVTNALTFNTPGGASRTLYSDDTFPNLPSTPNVRFGTTYGPGLGNTGTLVVPTPATVLLGVPTDNTTGTYLPSSPADFVTELNNSTIAVAVRMRNCATVATTGDQVASYGV